MSLFDSYGKIGQEPYQSPDRFEVNDYIQDPSCAQAVILQVTGTYPDEYILNAKTDGVFFNRYYTKGATVILKKSIVEMFGMPAIYKEIFNYNKFWDELNDTDG